LTEDFTTHPILVTKEIIARFGGDVRFSFSKYRIGPPGFQAQMERSVVTVTGQDLTYGWLQDQIERLPLDFELALQSNVDLSGSAVHIPMIDFGTKDEESVTMFPRLFDSSFYCFASGRSFHGYFSELINREHWLDFLGSLLLTNPSDAQGITDTRWIGHALQRGYSALRWSHRTNRYNDLPRLLFADTGFANRKRPKLA
jgi:hypothetical protein